MKSASSFRSTCAFNSNIFICANFDIRLSLYACWFKCGSLVFPNMPEPRPIRTFQLKPEISHPSLPCKSRPQTDLLFNLNAQIPNIVLLLKVIKKNWLQTQPIVVDCQQTNPYLSVYNYHTNVSIAIWKFII